MDKVQISDDIWRKEPPRSAFMCEMFDEPKPISRWQMIRDALADLFSAIFRKRGK